jgi:cell division protein FtsB
MRLAVKIFSVMMVFVGVGYLFFNPVRTYLGVKSQIAAQERTISVLQAEDTKLAHETAALQQPGTIERIARQDYGLVMPGQQAYQVLPSPAPAPEPASPKPKSAPWYSPLEFWHHF